MKYVLRHLDGTLVEVDASTETFARNEAMMRKWGPPRSLTRPIPGSTAYLVIGDPLYHGYGLDIISVQR